MAAILLSDWFYDFMKSEKQSVDGRMNIGKLDFISLSIISKIGVKYGNFMSKQCWSKDELMRELEKIWAVAARNSESSSINR
jgi:hypothetical protein